MEDLVMQQLFKGIYHSKKVLLTGHTGFKGSWLQLWLNELGAEVTGYSLAPGTDPSHFELTHPDGNSIIADIRDKHAIEKAVYESKPDIVFHLAAQPLVRKSYTDPPETFQTNVIGTVNLFEAIRAHQTVKAVVNVTTDKVYRNKTGDAAYKETDTLGGHDPYSTSKACVELVHESYRSSFFKEAGILSATARAGNVIGGGDWAEDRLIPDIVKAASEQRSTDIRNPASIRPWQHVLDPLSGYLLLGQHLLEGNRMAEDAWNFGPAITDCLPVNEVLDIFNSHWNTVRWNDISNAVHVHESAVLRLDCSKAADRLRWSPIWNIERAIEKTALWYKHYYLNGGILTKQDLNDYIGAAAGNAVWAL